MPNRLRMLSYLPGLELLDDRGVDPWEAEEALEFRRATERAEEKERRLERAEKERKARKRGVLAKWKSRMARRRKRTKEEKEKETDQRTVIRRRRSVAF